MEMRKRTFLLTIAVTVLLSVSLTYAFQQGWFTSHKVKANVYVWKETPEGIDLIASGNVITDIGERYTRNIMGWNNVTNHNATQWIALGNSTISQTNTKLDTEATSTGFTRAANDSCVHWINSGDRAYNVTKQFTATGNIQINATALHWCVTSNSDNNCFAMASLGGAEDFQNNWNCTITWVITYNFN